MFHRSLVLAGFAVMVAGAASAATEKFHATLTAAAEEPPPKSTGSGEATHLPVLDDGKLVGLISISETL